MFTELRCFLPWIKVSSLHPKFSLEKRAARWTKAPAYSGSGKGSHHLVYCTQPYPDFYTRGCFLDLNLWPLSHVTTTLPLRQGSPFHPKFSLIKKNHVNCRFQLTNYGSIFKCIRIKTFIFHVFFFFICFRSKRNIVFLLLIFGQLTGSSCWSCRSQTKFCWTTYDFHWIWCKGNQIIVMLLMLTL